MGNPFTTTSVSSYNSNPPPDDGSTGANNIVAWSTIKTKLPDPIKTAFDTSETNTNSAFGKVVGGGGFTSTAVNYTVLLADQGKFIKATASGITITTPDATSVGSPFVFAIVNESTGDITVAGNNPGVQQDVDGAVSFTLPAGTGVWLNTDGTNWFTAGQNFTKTNLTPKGRLTLVSGSPVMNTDETAKTSIFYTPYIGDNIPIPNGTTFSLKEFTELTLSLVANHTADTLYDIFVFLDPADNSTIRIGTGPAWSVTTAGSSARGTGAGTTELAYLKGFLVNNVAATMRNGATTYSVAAKSATYVGSMYTDHTAGNVSCHFSYGQNRKFGIWNMYNRIPVQLKVTDGTASWTYNTNTTRASDNAPASWSSAAFNVGSGTTCNGLTTIDGFQEEPIEVVFNQYAVFPNTAGSTVGGIFIGNNSITSSSGKGGKTQFSGATVSYGGDLTAVYSSPPILGISTFCCLELGNGTATNTFNGTSASMAMAGKWRA